MSNNNINQMTNNTPQYIQLDPKLANQVLNNVLESCNMEPTSIPVEVLAEWGNFNKPKFKYAKRVTYFMLVILILIPLLFFKPTIVAERVDVNSGSLSEAVYEVSIKSVIPVKAVSATLDGVPIAIEQVDNKVYRTEVTKNGELVINAISFNGQLSKRNYEVNHIDTERPKFVSSRVEDGIVYITIEDTYSGIDFDNIQGLKPISIDEESGEIAFNIPDDVTTVIVSDKAGNELQLLLQPLSN